MDKKSIVVVSGLPRSGTSLMMAMLKAGGLPLLTDKVRRADEDNPRGYFEYEAVKQLPQKKGWLKKAVGKAVKIIFAFLKFLPRSYDYLVILMERNLDEVLASQKQMLLRRGEKYDPKDDLVLKKVYQKRLKKVKAWLGKQSHFKVLQVSYNAVVKNPIREAKRANQFLGGQLSEEKMVRVVDQKLYRQRAV